MSQTHTQVPQGILGRRQIPHSDQPTFALLVSAGPREASASPCGQTDFMAASPSCWEDRADTKGEMLRKLPSQIPT